jgi:hypothetical protein
MQHIMVKVIVNCEFIKIVPYIIIVCLTSLYSMDQKPLIFCGFSPLLIPREVIELIKFDLTFQDIGRLKRVNKIARRYWDTENICPCLEIKCNTVACNRLAKCNYDTRTKVLAHYGKTRNLLMFQHVWEMDKDIRDIELLWEPSVGAVDRDVTIQHKMSKYRNDYCSSKKIEKRNLKRLVQALNYHREDIPHIQHLLSQTNFNIFDSAKEYRKKMVRITLSTYCLRSIFRRACSLEDPDLILAMLGGIIEPRAFKYLFAYASLELLGMLIDKNVIMVYGLDKRQKSFFDYMAMR